MTTKGITIPTTPRYFAAGCLQIAANMPGMCPFRYRPPFRPIPHSIHIRGIPNRRRAVK